jgi:hypothetical protein
MKTFQEFKDNKELLNEFINKARRKEFANAIKMLGKKINNINSIEKVMKFIKDQWEDEKLKDYELIDFLSVNFTDD